MDTDVLRMLLGMVIEANGGEVRLTQEQVENSTLENMAMVITQTEDEIILTLENEEDMDEYIEGQEINTDGHTADQGN